MKKIINRMICIGMVASLMLVGCMPLPVSEMSNASEAADVSNIIEEENQVEQKEDLKDNQEKEQNEESKGTERSIKIGALKGPTSLGLLFLDMDSDIKMATQADEILPLVAKGELDIALVPANAAANLYQKTNGNVVVIDINTLGVLYFVTGNETITSIEDLKGSTIYTTGKGTTPEASLRYVLNMNGFSEDDCNIEFKSEATEVAAILAENPDAVGLLPQPFVTAACIQNDKLKPVLDMNEEFSRVSMADEGDAPEEKAGTMVTGVTIANKKFVTENPEAIEAFLAAHAKSVEETNANLEEAGKRAVEMGIVQKEPIAMKAIPKCNIVCITGEDMKTALSSYLNVLYDFDKELVGGNLPDEGFYY